MKIISSIYVLKDPRNTSIRYVGWSKNPIARLRAHLNDSRKLRSHKDKWVNLLKRNGLVPIIEIIEQTTKPQEREIYWISRLRADGHKLTNATDGGEGALGLTVSAENRRKSSDRLTKKNQEKEFKEANAKRAAARMRILAKDKEHQLKIWTDANRIRQSKLMAKLNNDPDFQAKAHTKDNDEKASKRLKNQWNDPKFAAKINTPKQRQETSQRMKIFMKGKRYALGSIRSEETKNKIRLTNWNKRMSCWMPEFEKY